MWFLPHEDTAETRTTQRRCSAAESQPSSLTLRVEPQNMSRGAALPRHALGSRLRLVAGAFIRPHVPTHVSRRSLPSSGFPGRAWKPA